MNLASYYQRRPQMLSGLPGDYQYDENLDTSAQSSHPMFTSCDGLPRSSSQHLMNPSSLTSNLLGENNSFNLHQSMPTSMTMSNSSMSWADTNQPTASFETQNNDNNNNNSYGYGYSPSNMAGDEHNGIFFRDYQHQQEQLEQTPRYMPNIFSNSNHNNNGISLDDGFEPSSYLLDSSKPGMQSADNTMVSPFDYRSISNTRDLQRLSISISHSPAPKLEHEDAMEPIMGFQQPPSFGMASSESSDDGISSREMTAAEIDDHNIEEPYAKLIYRALMSRPDHSMVLQEIYQWFRENTQKGSADTKGWMNSIRHNLSMNAAFKKTERKTANDETKKSTEWVLEEFAIRDGVQSTTRYRKGNSAKKLIRNEIPTPSRVVSGRKGGISTKQVQAQAKLQHQQRQRSGVMMKTADERRGNNQPPTRATKRGVDNARRSDFHQQTRSQISQRQRSPLTPPSGSVSVVASPDYGHGHGHGGRGPYFFPKTEQLDMSYENLYRFEDVQGVCIDDGSPLFSSGHDAHFQSGLSMSNHRF